MSCLYILEIKPLLVDSFATVSSHSIGCLFIFLNDFLCCAEACKLAYLPPPPFLVFFRVTPTAYEVESELQPLAYGSQSNAGSEPIPHLTATPDP